MFLHRQWNFFNFCIFGHLEHWVWCKLAMTTVLVHVQLWILKTLWTLRTSSLMTPDNDYSICAIVNIKNIENIELVVTRQWLQYKCNCEHWKHWEHRACCIQQWLQYMYNSLTSNCRSSTITYSKELDKTFTTLWIIFWSMLKHQKYRNSRKLLLLFHDKSI